MGHRRLWLVMLIGPLAWLAYLETAYAFVPWACKRPTAGMFAALTAVVLALALSSAGLITAFQAWHRLDRASDAAGAATARTRLMALTGIGASAVFVLVVVAGMLPVLLLAPCN